MAKRFWAVVARMRPAELAALWVFISATKSTPPGGFKQLTNVAGDPQLFTLALANLSQEHLPVAHTCGLQLDLPPYRSQKVLAAKLRLAVSAGNEGFFVG